MSKVVWGGWHWKQYTGLECDVIQQAINIYTEISLEVHVCLPEKIYKVFILSILVFIFFRLLSFNFCCFNFGSLQNCMTEGLPKHFNFQITPWIATYYSVKNLGFPRSYGIFHKQTNQKKDRTNLSKNENKIDMNIQTSNKIG